MNRYPVETLDPDDDDGTMLDNVAELASHVVGHRIVSVKQASRVTVITLDNGKCVELADTDDCCAYTELGAFLMHPESVNHVIMGVGTTDGYTVWHVYADMGDVLKLMVNWSSGNPFYYGYGFDIRVKD